MTSDRIIDLRNKTLVDQWFVQHRPEYVFHCAARVGGISEISSHPVEYMQDNVMLDSTIIDCACRAGVKKLLLISSNMMYPRLAELPVKESSLLQSAPDSGIECYALAKIFQTKMGQYYRRQYGMDVITAVPSNVYGPGDHYDPLKQHVMAAMISKIVEAKYQQQPCVTFWGDGTQTREFLYVDDVCDGLLFCMLNYSDSGPINLGSGQEVNLKSLVELISHKVGYLGEIIWDINKPMGTPRKVLDISQIRSLGWCPKFDLEQGLTLAINWYLQNQFDHETT